MISCKFRQKYKTFQKINIPGARFYSSGTPCFILVHALQYYRYVLFLVFKHDTDAISANVQLLWIDTDFVLTSLASGDDKFRATVSLRHPTLGEERELLPGLEGPASPTPPYLVLVSLIQRHRVHVLPHQTAVV